MSLFFLSRLIYPYVDKWYLTLVVPCLLLSIYAQYRVKSAFKRYSRTAARSGIRGAEVARRILDQAGLKDVAVERVSGSLTDHYDPRSNVLRLSDSTYGSASVAAIGVAAHEAGHAIQEAEGYVPNRIRASLVPVARIGSGAGPYLAILGLMMSWEPLVTVGILLFVAAVLFYLVTLPVEFDASSRAIRILDASGILQEDELRGT